MAAFRRAEGCEVLLGTSSGDEQPHFRAGQAACEGAQAGTLTLYPPSFETDSAHLFIPFEDATSGAETHGAGRYLAVTHLSDGQVLPDFNDTSHPYCTYALRYRYPLPPAENTSSVSVCAGE